MKPVNNTSNKSDWFAPYKALIGLYKKGEITRAVFCDEWGKLQNLRGKHGTSE